MKKGNRKTINYYCIVFIILLNNWLAESSLLEETYLAIKPFIITIILLGILYQVFITRYTLPQFLLLIIGTCVCSYTSYMVESVWFLYLLFMTVFMKGRDIHVLLKLMFGCMLSFFAINSLIYLIQWIMNPSTINLLYSQGVYKHDLNFIGANEAARYWIFIVLLFYVIYQENRRIMQIGWPIIFIGTILMYHLTNSEALLLVGIIFAFFLFRNQDLIRKLTCLFARFSFLFIWIFSFGILFINGRAIFRFFNSLFTGRLFLGLKGLETYGITWFGQKGVEFFQWVQTEGYRLVVDNAYLYFMIKFGIVYLILFSLLFYRAGKKLNYKENVCLLVYSIYALAENKILSPTAIFPLLIAMDALVNRKMVKRTVSLEVQNEGY